MLLVLDSWAHTLGIWLEDCREDLGSEAVGMVGWSIVKSCDEGVGYSRRLC
jgi:hypothetical protein